jgi:predicted permease
MTLTRLPASACMAIALVPTLIFFFLARQLPEGIVPAIALAASAWALTWMIIYWRNLDETAREAQKTAWFWGGTLSGVASLMAAAFVPAVQHWIHERAAGFTTDTLPAENAGFMTGVLFVIVAQAAGFTLYLLGWWIAHRR